MLVHMRVSSIVKIIQIVTKRVMFELVHSQISSGIR